MFGKFSKADKILCEKLADGEKAVFKGENISPELIRDIFLGIDVDNRFSKLRAISQSALVISGARINGRLKLDNISAPGGGALPAIILERCTLVGGITLAHSHFARLSLTDCKFVAQDDEEATIDMRGCTIGSDAAIKVAVPEQDEGLLWLDAGGSRIDGDFSLNGSQFRSPAKREALLHTQPTRYAVSMAGADILGTVSGVGGLEADGGINIVDAHIGGDVWLSGAFITSHESDALTAQSARIDGSLMLNGLPDTRDGADLRVFRAEGPVRLLGAVIGRDLNLDSARVHSPDDYSILLDGAKIGGNLRIGSGGSQSEEARLLGLVYLQGTSVCGSAFVGPLAIGVPEGWIAFHCNGLEVEQKLVIAGVTPLPKSFLAGGSNEAFFALRPLPHSQWENPFGPSFIPHETLSYNGLNMPSALLGGLQISEAYEKDGDAVKRRPTMLKGGIYAQGTRCETDCIIMAEVFGNINLSGLTVSNGALKLEGLDLAPLGGDPETALPPHLILSDADISKAIQTRKRSPDKGPVSGPIEVREIALESLPGMTLMEALWLGEAPRMTGHLVRRIESSNPLLRRLGLGTKLDILTLTGRAQQFHTLNARRALKLGTIAQASEFLQLHCAYVQGDDGAFRILTSADDLPAGISADPEVAQKEVREAEAQVTLARDKLVDGDAATEAALEEAEKLLDRVRKFAAGDIVGGLADGLRPIEIKHDGSAFEASATVLYGNAFYRPSFKITASNVDAPIEMLDDSVISIDLQVPIRFNRKVIVGQAGGDSWPLSPTLSGMRTLSGNGLRRAQKFLLPQSPDTAELSNAIIDLEDAQCDTLRDGGGSDWGDSVTLKLDRFTYRHADGLRVGSEPTSPAQTSSRTRVAAFARQLRRARQQPTAIRYAWLLQQFDRPKGSRPDSRTILAQYRPQPFEQLIRVARASGDEEMASTIEIKKNWIEGRRRARHLRAPVLVIGGVFAAAWLSVNGFNTVMDVAVAGLILFGIGFLFDIGNVAFRVMFGYLRRPINALLTLIVSVGIGWGGVHLANANSRMVMDVTPIASSLSPYNEQFGTPIDKRPMASGVRCGKEINEALYAIDVFIPLIDLRQEERCTVGEVSGTELHYRSPTPLRPGFSAWWDGQAADIYYRTIASQLFWEIMKAAYGILGWVILSLSILTFARISKQPAES